MTSGCGFGVRMNLDLSFKKSDGFNEAVGLHLAGNTSTAIDKYMGVLKVLPNHLGALRNLGILKLQAGAFAEAVKLFKKAVRIDSGAPDVQRDLARALSAAGQLRAAVTAYRDALQLEPNNPITHLDLAAVFHTLGRRDEALRHYSLAIAIKPDFGAAHNDRGILLQEMRRFDDALEAFAKAVVFEPQNARCQANLGGMLLAKGRIADAVVAFEAAVALEPRHAQFLYYLAESKTFAPNDPYLALMTRLLHDVAHLPREGQTALHFALGKVLSDIGNHAGSFTHFVEGNRLKRREQSYDEAAALGEIDQIQVKFSGDFMKKKAGGGIASALPVFIVGMPRSGSTLVAQILSSHPKIICPGEIDDFGDAVASLVDPRTPPGTPASISALTANLTKFSVDALARRYLNAIDDHPRGTERVVDKALTNFRHLGLIHLALPEARIIHIKRNPVDTCVSCFSKMFATGHGFTYDLAELGRYYRAYQRLMEHWARVLPPGAIMDVDYEDLVADFEGQSRRMIAYCGLAWDPACLRFHENKRWVHTSSVVQVRRPLYDSSVGRSSQYGNLLEPLLTALR
jgi:Flp pilus assembly protein TadD